MLIASVGLVRAGFGMDWRRTLHGAWLVLRANQLWAPYPGNDPALACGGSTHWSAAPHGEPSDPAKAAELEVDWWRVHREGQYRDGGHAIDDAEPAPELVQALTRLYCFLNPNPNPNPKPRSARPRRTAPGPWTCPTNGSGRAASQTAACSRSSTRHWSVPTPPYSPPSTTDER